MMINFFPNFLKARAAIDLKFQTVAQRVDNDSWQSRSGRPEFATYELQDFMFRVPLNRESLDHWRSDIDPNLPWADEHFEKERVSGQPINPGETYKIWPWGHSAETFTDVSGQFDHSYAERYWSKHAAQTSGGLLKFAAVSQINRGIRDPLGDLEDLVSLLARDPHTRQAVLPVWFPEDTGNVSNRRIPCSITYTFMYRRGYLSVFYHMRSCDFIRHWKDDCYLTVRLLLWILNRLRSRAGSPVNWALVSPGNYSMICNSLHMFVNDYRQRYGGKND